MTNSPDRFKHLFSEEDFAALGKAAALYADDTESIYRCKRALALCRELTKEDEGHFQVLREICCALRVDKYEGVIDLVVGRNGRPRLQIDPQAGRSTDEPPVC